MKVRRYIFMALTLMWAMTIFSFSLQPATTSDETSISFLEEMVKLFAPDRLDELHSLPREQLSNLNYIVRKTAHFAEYFILGMLSMMTLLQIKIPPRKLWGMAFCALVAGLDEVLQLPVSGRAGRVTDVILDSAGAACGILLLYLSYTIYRYFCKTSAALCEESSS